MAEALYRKYRPQVFEDVVGQEHIERTIKNAIATDKVSHAYLFTGPRGTGKTTTARLLAKALLCEKGPTAEPDGTCEQCLEIAEGTHPDVYELDAASRTGVENVREEIIGRVNYAPTRGRYKVYIIDEVHMLSTAAFNALLKTLEEPPEHVVFIMCTTDPHKVLETIQSRCQRFDFRRISNEEIVSRLGAICMEEGIEFEGDALELVAQRAEGGMRDALTSLEQLITFGEGKVTLEAAERMLGALDSTDLAEIVRYIGARDVAACFRWTADYMETGADLAQFVHDLAERVRTMYVLTLSEGHDELAADMNETTRRELTEELPLFGADRLARMLGVLGDLTAELRVSTNPRLTFEIALTRMVRPDSDLTLEALAERIEALEQGYSARAAVRGAMGAASSAGAEIAGVQAASAPEGTAHSGAVAGDVAPAAVAAEAAATIEEAAREEAAASAQAASAVEPAPVAQSTSAPAAEPTPVVQAEVAEPTVTADSTVEPMPSAEVADTQPATITPAAGGPLPEKLCADLQNPAALQRVWQQIMTTLKNKAAAHGVLFLGTKAIFDSTANTLIIEFPAENEFAFATASKANVQEELAEAIQHVCNASLSFMLQKAGAKAEPASATTAQPAAQVAAKPATQAATSAQPQQESQPAATAQPASQPQPTAQPQPATQAAAQTPQPSDRVHAEADGQGAPQADTAMNAQSRSTVVDLPPEPEPRPDASTGASPQLTPEGGVPYDEVPIDAYDDIAPWEDGPVEEPAAAPAAATQAASAEVDIPASQGAPAAEDATAAQLAPAMAAADSADLDATLAAAFGEGAFFTEVTE